MPDAHIGFGTWETELRGKGNQVTIELPDEGPETTGHALFTNPNERGISEQVGAERLGAIPHGDLGPVARQVRVTEAVDNPNVCRIEPSPFRSPEAVIRHLYSWTFTTLLNIVRGYPAYERKSFDHIGRDRWRMIVDDAELNAIVPEIAGRCWKLVSMTPRTGRPLRSVRIASRTVTLELDWGSADAAYVLFGTGFEGRGGTLRRIEGPVVFQRHAPPPEDDVPTYVLIVLYEGGHVVSTQYGLYTPPSRP